MAKFQDGNSPVKLNLIATPAVDTDAANKAYVDDADDLLAPLASPTFTGDVVVPTPDADNEATTKLYVDTADALLAPLANPTFTGTVTVPATQDSDADTVVASKGYVDTNITSNIAVSDEGTQITETVLSFDFTGTGVTATAVDDAVTVTIPGGSGEDYVAINSISTLPTAVGNNSIAIGPGANTEAGTAMAIGAFAKSNGGSSLAIGLNADAGGTSSVSIGDGSEAGNSGSIAIGEESRASGLNSFAIGKDTVATLSNSGAIGNNATARAVNVITIGGVGGNNQLDQRVELHRQPTDLDGPLHVVTKQYVDDAAFVLSQSDVRFAGTYITVTNSFFEPAADPSDIQDGEYVVVASADSITNELQISINDSSGNLVWTNDNIALLTNYALELEDGVAGSIGRYSVNGEFTLSGNILSGTLIFEDGDNLLSVVNRLTSQRVLESQTYNLSNTDKPGLLTILPNTNDTSADRLNVLGGLGEFRLDGASRFFTDDSPSVIYHPDSEVVANRYSQIEFGSGFSGSLDSSTLKIDFSGGGSSALDDLTDVTIDTPTNNQVLTYNDTTSLWENAVSQSGGVQLDVANTWTAIQTFDVGLDAGSDRITSVATPTADTDATTKLYVDTEDNLKANLASPTFTGTVTVPATQDSDADTVAASKGYVDAGDDAYFVSNSSGTVPVAGGTDSIAIGEDASVSSGSTDGIAIGKSAAVINGIESIAIGRGARADGIGSLAVGINTKAELDNTVAIGNAAEARAIHVITIGGNGGASPQLAELHRQTESGDDDLHIATKKYVDDNSGGASALDDLTDVTLTTPTDNQVLTFDNDNSVWVNADSQAGDAYFVSNSDGTLPTAAGTDAISVGEGTTAAGLRAVSIGNLASVAGQSGVAIGRNAGASGSNSVALGHDAGLGETLDAGEIRLGNYETNVTVDSAFAGQETKANQVATTQYVTDHIAAAGGFINSENANELAVVVELTADNITYNLDLLDEIALGTAVSVNTSLSFPFPAGSLSFDDDDSWNLFTVNGSQSSSGVIAEYVGDVSNKGATVTFPSGGLEFDLVYSPGAGTNATSWTAIVEAFVQNTADSNVNSGTIIGRGFTDFTSAQGSSVNLNIGVSVQPVGSNGGEAKIKGGGAVGMRLRMVAVSAIDADVNRIITLDDDSGGKNFSIPTAHRDTDAQFILSNGGGDNEALADILYNNNVDPLKTLMFATDSVWTAATIGSNTPVENQTLHVGSGNIANWRNAIITVQSTGDSPIATGIHSMAIGQGADANANDMIAFGRNAVGIQPADPLDQNDGQIAIGFETTAANRSVALGYSANVVGLKSFAIGADTTAAFNNSGAIGDGTTARAINVVTVGNTTQIPELGRQTADDDNDLAIATKMYVDDNGGGASALDDLTDVTIANEANDQVLTFNSTTNVWENQASQSGGATTLPALNDVTIATPTDNQVLTFDNNTSMWVNADSQGGTDITVQDEGLNVETALDTLNFTGAGVTATGSSGTATVAIPGQPYLAIDSASDSTLPVLDGSAAIVMGVEAEASGTNAIAIGRNAVVGVLDAGVDNAIAIGRTANATAQETIAIGDNVDATTIRGVAIGSRAQATAQSAVALGRGAMATAGNAVAIGHDAEATLEGEIRLGNYTTKVTIAEDHAGDETLTNELTSVKYVKDSITRSASFISDTNANSIAVIEGVTNDFVRYDVALGDRRALGQIDENEDLSFPFPADTISFGQSQSWTEVNFSGDQNSTGPMGQYDSLDGGNTSSGSFTFDTRFFPGGDSVEQEITIVIEGIRIREADGTDDIGVGTIFASGSADFAAAAGSEVALDKQIIVSPVSGNNGNVEVDNGDYVGFRYRVVGITTSSTNLTATREIAIHSSVSDTSFTIDVIHGNIVKQLSLTEDGDLEYDSGDGGALLEIFNGTDERFTSDALGANSGEGKFLVDTAGSTPQWEDPELVVNQTGDAPTATGENAIAIGRDTEADQPRSLLIGRFVQTVVDDDSPTTADLVAIGDSAKAGNQAVALGAGSAANGIGSISIGQASEVSSSGTAGIAIGRNAIATGANGVAIGLEASATFSNSTAIGEGANARAASILTLGVSSTTPETARQTASDDNDLAIATKLYVDNSNTTAGDGLRFNTDDANELELDPTFNAQSKFFVVNELVTEEVATAGSFAVGVGQAATASGTSSLSIGFRASSGGSGAIAVGPNTVATFNNSGAIGSGVTSRAANVITIGDDDQTVETGRQTASGDNDLAVATKLYVDNSVAIDVTTVSTTKREANQKFREVWEGHNISEWDTSGSNTLRELWYDVENDESAGTHNVEIISNAGSTHYNMYFGAVADGTFISRWTKFVADAEGKVKFEYFTTVFTP